MTTRNLVLKKAISLSLANISTLAILISPRNPPQNTKMGSPKMNFLEFPGSRVPVEILYRNLNFPEFPGPSRCRILGSPFSAFWGEMKLICWAALSYPCPRHPWETCSVVNRPSNQDLWAMHEEDSFNGISVRPKGKQASIPPPPSSDASLQSHRDLEDRNILK